MSTELPEPPSKIELKAGVGGGGEIPTFNITLRVRRYLPETTAEAYWEDFKLTMYGTDRVLDTTVRCRSAAPAPTAFAVRMPCASTAATAWPARPC